MGYVSDWQQGFFYMYHPTDRIAHTMAFVTPVVKYWLEQELAQWVNHDKYIHFTPTHFILFKRVSVF